MMTSGSSTARTARRTCAPVSPGVWVNSTPGWARTMSSSFHLPHLIPEADDRMEDNFPDIYGKDGLPGWPRVIVVYAQWVPFSPQDRPDDNWFKAIAKHSIWGKDTVKPMSQLTADWI